jgi:hypothetical protein
MELIKENSKSVLEQWHQFSDELYSGIFFKLPKEIAEGSGTTLFWLYHIKLIALKVKSQPKTWLFSHSTQSN